MKGNLLKALDSTGFCGPFDLNNKTLSDLILNVLSQAKYMLKDRHVDCPPIRQIFFDRNLQNIIHSISINHWLLWRTNFFIKNKGAGEIKWHHDKHFQSGDDPIDFDELGSHLSIILALDDMNASNGAFEVIPGSHISIEGLDRDNRPFHLKNISDHFLNLPDWLINQSKVIEIRKGQFMVFHSALLHRSLPFSSGTPRVSMIGRLVKKGVELPTYLQSSAAVVPFNVTENSH